MYFKNSVTSSLKTPGGLSDMAPAQANPNPALRTVSPTQSTSDYMHPPDLHGVYYCSTPSIIFNKHNHESIFSDSKISDTN